MIRGILASRAGMRLEQQRSEVTADNVANVNTDGFRRKVAVGSEFEQMVLQRLGDPVTSTEDAPSVGLLGHGSVLAQIATVGEGGALRVTDNPLDLAISGPGEFTFLGPNGPGYTRSGAFHQNENGRLVTAEGYPVMVGGVAVGGPGARIEIEPNGRVRVNDEAAGRLDIRGASDLRLTVGALEASNVDLSLEMTDLIAAMRSFQVNQRALQMQDQTLARAVSEVGKV